MERIKELRENLRLSQQDVAERIGTSQRNIGRWENAENDISSYFLIKLADFFGCTIDYLVGREDDFGNVTAGAPSSDLSEDEKKVLSLFKRMPEARQRTVLDLLEGLSDDSAERGGEKRRA